MKSKNYKTRLIFFCILIALSFVTIYFLDVWFPCEEAKPEKSSEPLVTLSGKLTLKLFPGPPEYSSIEDGDRADYCWVLELDRTSFLLALKTPVKELALDLADILKRADANGVMLGIDEEMGSNCSRHKDQQVAVKGSLFHAHTAHHYTPMLMEVKQIKVL